MNEKHWGATPDDWDHFDLILGLSQDLLPVVSNPYAKVSAKSTVKAFGKVPSLYNKNSEAVGIADWTSKHATAADLEKWEAVSDYGICLQTRKVRALDIDVEDLQLAKKIEDLIFGTLGFVLPKRFRADSAKRLLIYSAGAGCCENKRVLPVEGGIIEYLALGQQFIAIGTHTGGARYEWAGGLPYEIPELIGEVEAVLWENLRVAVGVGQVSESGTRKPKSAEVKMVSDDTNDALELLGLTVGKRGRDGTVYIECPWKHEHTERAEKNAGTSTAYFPAGGRGYEQGHFKCLHAHCAGRSDREFRIALGLEPVCDFEDLGALPPEEVSAIATSLIPLQDVESKGELKQNEDSKVLAVIENVALILNTPNSCGRDIRYDTFRDEIVYKRMNGAGYTDTMWQPFTDTDYTELRIYLANTGFLPISHDMMRQAVQFVAKKRMFDTAIEWINTLKWDGIPRVKEFLTDIMGAIPDERHGVEYNNAVSDYMWTALAGRIIEPGCKADAAPIFVGEQFIGKTFAIMNMVPDMRYYCEINFEDKDDDLARKMRGKMVAEFAEMRGFQGRDSEGTKAFISRQFEEWTPKYMEFVTVYPRRLLFIGSYNGDEIFTDETGNRREFPVKVKKADIEYIKNNRDQLWAEGKKMFYEKGIEYYYRVANKLADGIRSEFMITDAWDEDVINFLHAKDLNGYSPLEKEYFTMREVMVDALHFDVKNFKTYEMKRVGKILKKHGCENVPKRINGVTTKVWRSKK